MARKRLALEIGMGTDLQGGDYTKAAIRAVEDALRHNSLTVAPALGYPRESMDLDVRIGVARPEEVDLAAVGAVLPYGRVRVRAQAGGLDVPKDEVADAGEGPEVTAEVTVIASAAIVVLLDIDEAPVRT